MDKAWFDFLLTNCYFMLLIHLYMCEQQWVEWLSCSLLDLWRQSHETSGPPSRWHHVLSDKRPCLFSVALLSVMSWLPLRRPSQELDLKYFRDTVFDTLLPHKPFMSCYLSQSLFHSINCFFTIYWCLLYSKLHHYLKLLTMFLFSAISNLLPNIAEGHIWASFCVSCFVFLCYCYLKSWCWNRRTTSFLSPGQVT